MRIFVFLGPLLLLLGCEEARVENKDLSKKLVGEWRNIELQIRMNTFNNTDSVQYFEANEGNWEEKMKIKPIRTFFYANGTYHSEHRNLKDSIIFDPGGKWVIYGDSLIMTDTFPELGLRYSYKLEIRNSLARFWGREDCDRDGYADDEYYSAQWRH